MRCKIVLVVAAAVVLLAAGLVYAGAPLPVREAPLAAGGDAYELNRGATGSLLLSDYGADEIRRIDAASGAYVAYRVSSPVDARQDAAGRIWFTNAAERFGFVNAAAGTATTWALGDPSDFNLWGLAFDDAGRVWLTEWFGSASQLRRFDPASRELCAYALPGSAISYYIIYQAGTIWTANWANDRIYRIDAATGEGRFWALGSGAGPLGLALDPEGRLWVADAGKGALLRLSPGESQLTTYALPTGSEPQMVTLIDGKVWYTEIGAGTVGVLDPAAATGSSSSPTTGTFTAPLNCQTLGAGTTTQAPAANGALTWSSGAWEEAYASAGWTVYRLPAGAQPYGIAGFAGMPWVVDRGRQMVAQSGGPAATGTPTPSPSPSPTSTPSPSPTSTPTRTATSTATRTATLTASVTPTATGTATPTVTATRTAGPSGTPTQTPAATSTPTAGPSPTPSPTGAGPNPPARTYLPLLGR